MFNPNSVNVINKLCYNLFESDLLKPNQDVDSKSKISIILSLCGLNILSLASCYYLMPEFFDADAGCDHKPKIIPRQVKRFIPR